MDDREIIQLYINKNERAIQETDKKYRAYLLKIAMNILGNLEDSEECLNDTYMSAWKNIKLGKDYNLKYFLTRITKNNALNIVKKYSTEKRGGGQYEIALDELEDVLQSDDSPENRFMKQSDSYMLMRFLDELPELDRRIFVRRYWFMDSPSDIAKRYGISYANTKIKIHRTLKKLRAYLEEHDT